jgi:hypothetical protein
MVKKKKKGFSMVEILFAGILAMSLAVLVSVTLNSATKSLRIATSKGKASSISRDLNSKLQQYISSAQNRVKCMDAACDRYENEGNSKIFYYGQGSDGIYRMEFYSYSCPISNPTNIASADNRRCDSDTSFTSPAQVSINFDPISETLYICRDASISITTITFNLPISTAMNCKLSTDTNKIIYQTSGVSPNTSSSSGNIFKIYDIDRMEIFNISSNINNSAIIKVAFNVDWGKDSNIKIDGKKIVGLYSTDTYINLLSGNS